MAANSILKLSVETSEYDAKLKKAAEGIRHLAEVAHKGGGELTGLEKAELEYIKALGSMETKSQSAAGKTRELENAFKELTVIYNKLNEYEKADEGGKALRASLDQLKERAKEAKVELEKVGQELSGSKFGQFGSVIDTIGQKMGIGGNLTQMLTSDTALMTSAIGASIAVIGKATEAWVGYNNELAKQDQITQVTTGLKGDNADRMTDSVRALADTYNIDFREAINAANIFMTQFGKTGDEAIQLLRDGMQGMITGDGLKMLSMIQQFAPAFRDAGISADQLVAIIHNSEGGLFSEQNMNAILMGIKNIRLMTDSTSKALAQLGIDGQDMSRKMSDGSMTVFQALRQVAEAIENAKAGSQEAGQVMQQVFGRQGAMQGMKLGRAIAELNTNLEETKRQTGEVGEAYNELYDANIRLNTAIRNCFEYDGWEQMATGIKATLVTALSNVINKLVVIKTTVAAIAKLAGGSDGGNNRTTVEEAFNNLKGSDDGKWNGTRGYTSDYQKQTAPGGYVEVKDANGKVIKSGHFNNENQRQKIINSATTTGGGGKVSKTPPKLTDAQQAEVDVRKAMKDYADAISNAQEKVMANMITSDDYDKQVQQGQQKLADAYLKAYNVTGDEKYLEGFRVAAGRYNEMGEVIKGNIDAQKEQQAAARELAQTQKKVATAMAEAQTAYQNNDLKGYLSAMKKAGADPSQGMAQQIKNVTATVTIDVNNTEALQKLQQIEGITIDPKTMTVTADDTEALQKLQQIEGITIDPKTVKINYEDGGFTYTGANLDAFIGNLKEQLSQADLGSTLYNNLTAQLADATSLGNLMQEAVKNGIDIAQFAPQDLWKKIFGENPGDYIDDDVWKGIVEKINEELKKAGKKGITLDTSTGQTKGIEGGKQKSVSQTLDTVASGVNNIVGGLKQLGVDIPEGISTVIGVVQTVAGILTGISALITIITATTAAKAVPVIGWLLHNGGVVHAANGINVVPGNRMSGDMVPAMLESGEVVLNRAQVNNLASQLENNNGGNIEVVGVLKGEDIILMANRYGQRTGRGKIMFDN